MATSSADAFGPSIPTDEHVGDPGRELAQLGQPRDARLDGRRGTVEARDLERRDPSARQRDREVRPALASAERLPCELEPALREQRPRDEELEADVPEGVGIRRPAELLAELGRVVRGERPEAGRRGHPGAQLGLEGVCVGARDEVRGEPGGRWCGEVLLHRPIVRRAARYPPGMDPLEDAPPLDDEDGDEPEAARTVTNGDLARIFHEIGDILEVKGELVFKTVAYHRAADAIARAPFDVGATYGSGERRPIPGVGAAIADKIAELATTGRMAYYDKLRAEIPSTLVDLLRIPGVGPKTVRIVWEGLGIADLAELKLAAQEGRLRDAQGHLGEHRGADPRGHREARDGARAGCCSTGRRRRATTSSSSCAASPA